MESKNDAPRIIIQLIISALVYYLFTFKYKDILISTLSIQVYYQVLVIVVITNSYFSKGIDAVRLLLIHKVMMAKSKHYRAKHYQTKAQELLEKSKTSNLSEEAKQMIEEMSGTNIELESEISEIHKELNKFKKTNT